MEVGAFAQLGAVARLTFSCDASKSGRRLDGVVVSRFSRTATVRLKADATENL
jgi:hypothetical protein